MSRYTISEDEHLEVVVGWDPPLATFFAQEYDPTVPDDENDCVWSCGHTPGEIPHPSLLEAGLMMRGLPAFAPELKRKLLADCGEPWKPGPIQKLFGFGGKAGLAGPE